MPYVVTVTSQPESVYDGHRYRTDIISIHCHTVFKLHIDYCSSFKLLSFSLNLIRLNSLVANPSGRSIYQAGVSILRPVFSLQILSQSGWTGLYKGLKPSLLGTTVSQGIYFYLYSLLRQAAVSFLQNRGKGKHGKQLHCWILVNRRQRAP